MLRLAGCFGTTPRFWMHLQAEYDLAVAARASAARIARNVHPRTVEAEGLLGALDSARASLRPLARVRGILTDDDVFSRIS